MANTIEGFGAAVITFLLLAIVLGIGGSIMSEVSGSQCDYTWLEEQNICGSCPNSTWTLEATNSSIVCWRPNNGTLATSGGNYTSQEGHDLNASLGGLEGVETFGEWLPTIAVILAAALVIGIITTYFYLRS